MFRVAVCDDEPLVCAELERLIKEYGKRRGLPVEVECYCGGEELFKAISTFKEAAFDLIFLDIQMGNLSGVETGRKIREELRDEAVQIVYISASREYSMDLFAIRPINFLIKPLNEQEVFADLTLARRLSNRRKQFFSFDIGKDHFRIPVSRIMYFESRGRKIQIAASEGPDCNREFYGKLATIEEELRGEDFLRIHRSYLVNEHWVEAFQYDQITLFGGVKLPISQPYRPAVRNRLINRE